jgi:hypothetical protein
MLTTCLSLQYNDLANHMHATLYCMIYMFRKCTLSTSLSLDRLQTSQRPLQHITTHCSKTIKQKKIMCACVCGCTCGRVTVSTNASVPCHESLKWVKLQFSTQHHSSHISPASTVLDCTTPHMLDLSTEGHGRVASSPVSQLGGPGFRSQLTDELPWFFTILLSLSGQIPGRRLKSRYDHFLTNPFQLTIHSVTITKFDIPTAMLAQLNK